MSLTAVVAWLVAAWVVPATAHVLSVGWLVPPLILAVTAGLLRAGTALIDRLVLAGGLLMGAVCAAGLLLTVWPFGLSPVAAGGSALTVLGVVSAVTGRVPRLPRPSGTDLLTLGAAGVVVAYLVRPYLRADATARLALAMAGEDNARHLSVLDAVRRLGGYPFVYGSEAIPELFTKMRHYPSGWHLTVGLLDNFVRSSTAPASPGNALDHYIAFAVVTYGLLALVVVWAAQWLAGPLLSSWRRLPLVAFLVVLLLYSDLPTMLIHGFPSEVAGLSMLVLVVAIVSRPARHVPEQLVLLGALLVGIAYVYYLLLPPACLAALAWVLWNRRASRGHRTAVVAAGFVAVVAAVPPVLGLFVAGQRQTLTLAGAVAPVSRATLLAMAGLVAAGVFSHAGRRLRAWRRYAWLVLFVVAVAASIGVAQYVQVGHTTYYFEKYLHAIAITLMIGVGGVVLLLPAPRRARGALRTRIAAAVPAAALSLAICAAFGLIIQDSPYRPTILDNPGRWWVSGRPERLLTPGATIILEADRRWPPRADTVAVVLSDAPYASYQQTLFLTTLQRNSRMAAHVLYDRGLYTAVTPDEYAALFRRVPGTVRVITTTPEAAVLAVTIRREHPELRIDVLALDGL